MAFLNMLVQNFGSRPIKVLGNHTEIDTWLVWLFFIHFMSFSHKSEHDTVADLATLKVKPELRHLTFKQEYTNQGLINT